MEGNFLRRYKNYYNKTVKDGEKITRFEPKDVNYTKADFTFKEWYATSTYSVKFGFNTTAIKKDTNVYSQWRSAAVDTRQWLIAGESSAGGPLKTIGWNSGPLNGDIKNILTKDSTKNEFSITINLYIGDKFQLCVQDSEGAWVEEDGKDYARGGKFLESNTYMESASGGLGDGQSNIIVKTAGNYTLTLETDFIDNDAGSIKVVRNGDAPEVVIDRSSYTWHVYGASKTPEADSMLKAMAWGVGVADTKPYEMLRTSNNAPDGTGSWLLTGKFAAEDEFLFAFLKAEETGLVAESGTLFPYDSITDFGGLEANFEKAGMGGNIKVKTAGMYTFKLTVTENADKALVGAIEIIDNDAFLKSEQKWIVFGNRLTNAQLKKEMGITLSDEEYAVYTSDLIGNDWGKGENVDVMAKAATPSTGVIQYTLTLNLGVGDYFYFGIPVSQYHIKWGYSETGGYKSTTTPAALPQGGMPEGLGTVWTNNFACTTAGSYTFTVTIDAAAKISITAVANA